MTATGPRPSLQRPQVSRPVFRTAPVIEERAPLKMQPPSSGTNASETLRQPGASRGPGGEGRVPARRDFFSLFRVQTHRGRFLSSSTLVAVLDGRKGGAASADPSHFPATSLIQCRPRAGYREINIAFLLSVAARGGP